MSALGATEPPSPPIDRPPAAPASLPPGVVSGGAEADAVTPVAATSAPAARVTSTTRRRVLLMLRMFILC